MSIIKRGFKFKFRSAGKSNNGKYKKIFRLNVEANYPSLIMSGLVSNK